MTYDPTTPSWKQKPTTDRQTDKDWGRERASPHFAPTQKESQTLAMQRLRDSPSKGWPQGSFLLLFLHFGLLLATPCPLPSLSLQLSHPRPITPTRTFSVLSGPPCPRASGEAAIPASSLLPARAWPDPLCPVCGTHTAAPLSLRSGAERCLLIRGGVVYGGYRGPGGRWAG